MVSSATSPEQTLDGRVAKVNEGLADMEGKLVADQR
jgi:hypothetical protein